MEELLEQGTEGHVPRAFLRLGKHLLIQELLEQEVKDLLVKAFREDQEALLSHLKFPVVHRRSIRTTNLIERSFEMG